MGKTRSVCWQGVVRPEPKRLTLSAMLNVSHYHAEMLLALLKG